MLRLILGVLTILVSYELAILADFAPYLYIQQWYIGASVAAFLGGLALIFDSLTRK